MFEIPDRYRLRTWGRRYVMIGIVCILIAAVLDRAHKISLEKSQGQVEWHEREHHEDEHDHEPHPLDKPDT